MKFDDMVLAAVVAAALLWPQIKGYIPGGVVPGPAPVPVSVPDATAQAAVAPVVALMKGNASRGVYAGYWSEFGELIQKRPNDFKTVGDVVSQHRVASDLFFDLDPKPVPGLSAAMEIAIKSLLGEEDKAITPADATRATNALVWACSQ